MDTSAHGFHACNDRIATAAKFLSAFAFARQRRDKVHVEQVRGSDEASPIAQQGDVPPTLQWEQPRQVTKEKQAAVHKRCGDCSCEPCYDILWGDVKCCGSRELIS